MKNNSLNQIKFIASIFVVFIHTSFFKNYNKSGYILDFIIDSTARFGVPIFFAISGYFLYEKFKKNQFMYYLNYVKKILFLHLWVGLSYKIFTYFDVLLNNGKLPSNFFNFHTFTKQLFSYGLYLHLWFLPALVIAVSLLFIFKVFHLEELGILIALILHILSMFGSGEIYVTAHSIPMRFLPRTGITIGFFYVSLGYIISKYKINEKINFSKRKFTLIISSLCLIQLIERSYFVIKYKASQGSNYFTTTIFLVFFILIFALNYIDLFPRLNKVSSYSLEIYLWHPLIMIILHKILMDYLPENSFIYNLIFTPLVVFTILFIFEIVKFSKKSLDNYHKKI